MAIRVPISGSLNSTNAPPAQVFAFANAQLKRQEETLRYLEQSYQQRSPELVFVQNDPNRDFLHSDPRYRAIIKTMGPPRAY